MIFRFVFLIGLSLIASGQVMRVPQEALGERIVVVVPMVGKGTVDDPVRPKYTPVAMSLMLRENLLKEGKLEPARVLSDAQQIEMEKRRIGAYSYVLSDDGKQAIVEFVAGDRAAFEEILKDTQVKTIAKSKLKDEAEILELRKIKKGFEAKDLRTAGY